MSRDIISTPKAPAAIGPYSQAIRVGNMVFTSGQIALDPATGTVEGDVKTQARRVFDNLSAVLAAAGSSLGSVVKFTCFITDMTQFPVVNAVFTEYLDATGDRGAAGGKGYPARSTVEVSALPKGALVEIEAVALVDA